MGFAAEDQQNQSFPPMLMQYLDYKARYPDCLLLFQVGDFYEVFFEDAVTVARAINLTLTSRDKNNPNPVPMCGVPIAVADTYAERLVQLGFSVAIVNQCEPPSGKGMVARKLERIITPGIRILGAPDAEGGLVAAIQIMSADQVSIAYSDISSGKIFVREGFSTAEVHNELSRINPHEVVLPKAIQNKPLDKRTLWVRALETVVPERNIKFRNDLPTVLEGSKRQLQEVPGFKSLSPLSKRSVAFLVSYIDEITVEATLSFTAVETASFAAVMSIDATTRLNLELLQNTRDASSRGTLYEYLHKTKTPGGSRLLREILSAPLLNKDEILFRQNIVEEFVLDRYDAETLERALHTVPDLERIATRLELNIVTPRELGALRDALCNLPSLLELLIDGQAASILASDDNEKLIGAGKELSTALVDVPPLVSSDGEIFRDGYNEELTRLIELSRKGKEWIAELEQRERELTGIPSLKIKYNGVFGYFIEVTNTHKAKVPDRYFRKQTTVNSERYITEELKQREDEVLGAAEKRISLEKVLFEKIKERYKPLISACRLLGRRISLLDLLYAFAVKAKELRLVRPTIAEESSLHIISGRHPQLSESLKSSFIPNDIDMKVSTDRCLLITGPNMGGKSTYLRQAALIAIMAQIGSFVPAERATIGIVDKIFARLGASDNIAEGESTFMVEMREAATILSSATKRSLILIDEIGRGTATLDGLALAQAIIEWLVTKTRARTLFATHFHELTDLSELYDGAIKNLSVGSIEENGQVLFTHQIKDGAANKSYGIEVARLAGVPIALIERASQLLEEHQTTATNRRPKQQSFEFVSSQMHEDSIPKDYNMLLELQRKLISIDVNSTTPIEALQMLEALQKSIGNGDIE